MGRSPHLLFRPSEIDVSSPTSRVRRRRRRGREVVNLFLAHKTSRTDGRHGAARCCRRSRNGKTYMAKAMAREAGVPFLCRSQLVLSSRCTTARPTARSAVTSSNSQVPRREGGAIGFIEEIDAIGGAAPAWARHQPRRHHRRRERVLIRCHRSTRRLRAIGWSRAVRRRERLLRRVPAAQAGRAAGNVLVIGATNRAADLDPRCCGRPVRPFGVLRLADPQRAREIIDFYLTRRHTPRSWTIRLGATRWPP